jgi:hypothetical protein
METLIYIFLFLSCFVALIFWYCLPDKDEADFNPYS